MKDVNETRYHLVLGAADWHRSQSDGAAQWEYDSTWQGIQLQSEVFTFQTQGTASPLDPLQRRDSDRDPYGHRYWIDAGGTQIWVQWAKAQTAAVLFPVPPVPCAPDPTGAFQPAAPPPATNPEPLAGLAVLPEGYLVVGSPTTGTLLAFDLYALDGGWLRVPIAPGLTPRPEPFDLAASPQGGLLVLDRTHRTVWAFNRYLRPVPVPATLLGALTPFQPQVGGPRRLAPTTTVNPRPLDGATVNPIAIAPLPDGAFWILDQPATGASVLWYYPADGTTPQALPLLTANLIKPGDADLNLTEIRGYDLAYLPHLANPPAALGTLFLAEIAGNQAFALQVVSLAPLTLRLERRYYPLRHFSPVSLITDRAAGEVFYQQPGVPTTPPRPRWLPIKALPRQRYKTEATLLPSFWDGTFQPWDGKEPNCVWHRLCLDACIPPETRVTVEARASDRPEELTWATWQEQPRLYRRPSTEVPYSPLWSPTELTDPHTGTWELLFQGLQGRYLEIRLTLQGNGRSTPLIRALRAHYPRFSYLREYLPQVYQQDAASLGFLERFLANPEGIFTLIEGLIAQVQTLMDVHTVPTDALEWLASWIGLALDPGWSDYQRRLLIAQAPYFYQRRGTTAGLLQAILLTVYPQFGPRIFRDDVAALCPTVRIVERFLTRTLSGAAAGDPTDPTQPTGGEGITEAETRAHRFIVMVPTSLTPTTHNLVERIVSLGKPAHTAFTLKQYWALFRVGDVRLGLDTVLGRGGQFDSFHLGQSALAEAVLSESFPYTLTNRTVISR
jgi:phage tail-like protein